MKHLAFDDFVRYAIPSRISVSTILHRNFAAEVVATGSYQIDLGASHFCRKSLITLFAMSGPSKTTIIFVPGAWHGPEWFDQVAKKLQAVGYQTDYVTLASVGPKEHLPNMQPDVEIIRQHIIKAADKGQKVNLAMHSYGSVPAMDAAYGLDYRTRQAAGKSGGVTHLFFISAFIIPAGQSLITAFGGNPLPWFDISADQKEVNPINPEEIFYNDLPPEQVKQCVAALKPFSYSCHHSPLTHATWQTIPSTYLFCSKDNAVPTFVQELMVNEFAKGVEIRVEKVDSGHSPFLSKPDETAIAIQRAAELPV